MHPRIGNAALTCLSALVTAGTASAFALYPANGFLGYAYNKWGDPAIGTSALIYWSLMPVGTGGSAYCGAACPGTSTLSLPSFYDWNTNTFSSVQLSDPVMIVYLQNALNTWARSANVTFRYLPVDAGVPIDDPAAEPPATGHIRIGVFNSGFNGPAAVGFAPPPNGFIPNSSQLATGAGDVIFGAAYSYQNPTGADGEPLQAFPQGGGPFLNDFQGLALHEIGHALGIDHSAVADAVMCGFPNTCTYDDVQTYEINRELNPDDVAGIRTLYGVAPDTDGDGVVDSLDNCKLLTNANQRDTNGDGYGNACDPDFNGNGIVDSQDGALLKARFGSSVHPDQDLNGNGIVDSQDGARLKAKFGQPPGPSGLVP